MTGRAADIVVFSPHPDDEVIGCGGVIQSALAAGKRVRVVFSTSGDGYPQAAATLLGKTVVTLGPADFIRLGETRRAEAYAADAVLGLDEQDIVHLGFPDGAFDKVAAATGEPVTAVLTRLSASPTTGAPFTRAAAVEQFAKVLDGARPETVYVTDAADEHADHRATYEILMAAIHEAGSRARVETFVVHTAGDRWPDPGPCFETKTIDGVVYPAGVPWPPPIRLPITPAQQDVKRRALMKHASQWVLDHEYLGAFVKTEEVFWRA